LERAATFFRDGLGAAEVYNNKRRNFSLFREKFFLLGGQWIASMQGQPPDVRSYQHLAFKVAPESLP
jgi:hypothetical protein